MRKRLAIIYFGCLFFILGMSPGAFAQEKYTIKEMTPSVIAALENRRNRYDELQELKKEGKIGETNQGYVKAFSDEGSVQSMADAENHDREMIYRTIAEQNGLTAALNTIEKVFAQTQRDNAEHGEKIQLDNGSWATK
ncbi:MAG: DUF1318 domain-containing protein [Candidatus Omnitrophota bacterium]